MPTTPVFPADQAGWFSPPEVREIFQRTAAGLQHNGNNAPLMLATARARLDMPGTLEWLHTEVVWRERPNGTLSFNRLDPEFRFNDFGHYTEMFGVCLPINELLLQSVGDVLRLFPAWPGHRAARFTRLRAQGGFLVSAVFEDGQTRDPTRLRTPAGHFVTPMSGVSSKSTPCRARSSVFALIQADRGLLPQQNGPSLLKQGFRGPPV